MSEHVFYASLEEISVHIELVCAGAIEQKSCAKQFCHKLSHVQWPDVAEAVLIIQLAPMHAHVHQTPIVGSAIPA